MGWINKTTKQTQAKGKESGMGRDISSYLEHFFVIQHQGAGVGQENLIVLKRKPHSNITSLLLILYDVFTFSSCRSQHHPRVCFERVSLLRHQIGVYMVLVYPSSSQIRLKQRKRISVTSILASQALPTSTDSVDGYL